MVIILTGFCGRSIRHTFNHLENGGFFLYSDDGKMEWKLDILGGEYWWYISFFCDNCEDTTASLGISNIYAAFAGNKHFFPNR